jgi:ATP-binding cassette subfamily B protein
MHWSGWYSYLMADDDKPRVTRALVARVLAYARPYRAKILAVLALILCSTLLGLLPPLLFGELINNALQNKNRTLLNWLALGMIAVPIISGLLGILQRYLSASIGEGVITDLRIALYGHIQHMSMRFFTNTRTGELMSRLNNDVVGAQSAINSTLISLVTNTVAVVGTLAIMLALEWRLTVLGLVVVPLFVLPARRIGRLLRDMIQEQSELNAQMNAMVNETLNISGALLVKLFGRGRQETERFASRARRVSAIGVRRAVTGNIMFLSLGLISTVGVALTYWLGGHLTLDGVFTPGLIVAFGLYLAQLYGPLQALANAPVEFASSMVSFERVFEITDLPVEVAEKPGALSIPPAQVRGEVQFDAVSFTYAETPDAARLKSVDRGGIESVRAVFSGGNPASKAEGAEGDAPSSQARQTALESVSFAIRPGQLAALVGPSGAGKTTITYLLPRLYDPTAGRVTLDGHDLRDLTLETLAGAVGMVTQETYLFHDTIKTNLLYARQDATDAQIEAAARAANIHEFISALPDGYDTIVGERGYRLSGGEKQRIAIARVILKDPRILVLDEATSHLDSQSEALIQAALETVMQGRTSLVIAHRLSTVLAADIILVLDRGRIVEQGTHAQLLAQHGLYAALYETQFRRGLVVAQAGEPESA